MEYFIKWSVIANTNTNIANKNIANKRSLHQNLPIMTKDQTKAWNFKQY